MFRLRMCGKDAARVYAGELQPVGAVQSDRHQRRAVPLAEASSAQQRAAHSLHTDHPP